MRYLTKKMIAGKHFQRFNYPNDIDEEMIDLMDVLNNIPGCRTMYSCQGHGHGQWYFVVYCCNGQVEFEIEDYFGMKRHLEVRSGSMASPTINGCKIKERSVAVYDRQFDKQTSAEKKKAYSEMCMHLLQFVPREFWQGK